MSEFASAQTGEIGLRAIDAGAADAEAVLVIDPLHGEAGMQRVPRRALVGMDRGALGDPLADRRQRRIAMARPTTSQQEPSVRYDFVSLFQLIPT
jgi:hypothetical protein